MEPIALQTAAEAPPTQLDLDLEQFLAAARKLVGEREFEQAERLCRAIHASCPEQIEPLSLLSQIAYTQRRSGEALAWMRRVIALQPEVPKHHNNLGFLHTSRGEHDDAVAAYQRAVALDPTHVLSWVNLAAGYKCQKRLELARETFQRALVLEPNQVFALQQLGDISAHLGEYEVAAELLERALAQNPKGSRTRALLTQVYRVLGKVDKLERVYRGWIEAEPEAAAQARHMLAACTGEDVPARASDSYIQATFDDNASSFERHLVGNLGYRAPAACAEAFARCAPAPTGDWSIVDLGCGTGLCGPLFAPWAGALVGVDLSGGMLEQARAKGVYRRLHRAELTAFLAGEQERWHAAVCADTFCYFGALEAPLQAAFAALRSGGLFVFTVEAEDDAGTSEHRLWVHGRYSHKRAYVLRALADTGFRVREVTEETLRFENRLPVRGFVVVAQKG